jgi:uncharacterized protein (TIGR03083 family)
MTIDFLAHLRSESAAFGAALASADPSASVPTCPDWTAADLLWHLAEVQLFWGAIVRDRLDDPDAAEAGKPDRPSDYAALLELYRSASAGLADALDGVADDVAVWTWFDADQTVGFVRRRQAHEALIHRFDAELTAGVPAGDVDSALASDGVLEALEWMYGGYPEWAHYRPTGTVGRLATTDTGTAWLVELGRWGGHSPNTGKDYQDEPALTVVQAGDPTFSITGTARDLDAWLWHRPTLGEISTDGDAGALEEAIKDGPQ